MCSALMIAENEHMCHCMKRMYVTGLSDVLVMQGDIVFESQRETKLQKCFKMYLLVICTTLNDILKLVYN